MDKKNKIDGLIDGAIKNLSELIDVNTVIGDPITTAEGCIIPVSRVTVGYITGGGEYGEVKYFKKDENYPFSGGSGAVVSLKPTGFLIDNGRGFKFVNVNNDCFERIMSICEEAVEKLNSNE